MTIQYVAIPHPYLIFGDIDGYRVYRHGEEPGGHLHSDLEDQALGHFHDFEHAELFRRAITRQVDPEREKYVFLAQSQYASENIDIDHDAGMIKVEDGAWVEAWLWVDDRYDI